MILRYFVRDLMRRLPLWDPASKISLGIATVLLVVLFWMGFAGPQQIQVPARFGAFGLLLTLQLLFFWGNRRAISPYHQAQKHFIDGEYVAARKILEQIPDNGRASVDALVLLGNTYRRLGEFELGKRTLRRALELKPDYHFAWYAVGKLSLVTGKFGDASDQLTQALDKGAPAFVHFDTGLAYFMKDENSKAGLQFAKYRAGAADEPEKQMLATYLQFIIGGVEPPSKTAIRQYLSPWQDEATKYSETPFGSKLEALLAQLQQHLQST